MGHPVKYPFEGGGLKIIRSNSRLMVAVIHNLGLGDMAGVKDYLYQAANGLRILGATDPLTLVRVNIMFAYQ